MTCQNTPEECTETCDPSCGLCNSEGCETCNINSYLNSDKSCTQCPSKCLSCENATTCTSCPNTGLGRTQSLDGNCGCKDGYYEIEN